MFFLWRSELRRWFKTLSRIIPGKMFNFGMKTCWFSELPIFGLQNGSHTTSLWPVWQLFYQIPYHRTGLRADSLAMFSWSGDFRWFFEFGKVNARMGVLWVYVFVVLLCSFRRSDEAKGQLHQAVKRKKESTSDHTRKVWMIPKSQTCFMSSWWWLADILAFKDIQSDLSIP